MNYNFDLAVSATISAKVAEEMIKRIVEEQTGKKVASVEVRLQKESNPGETVFDGYRVFFHNEPVIKKSDRGFVPAKYQ